jgi:RimJ/RimL family protein N-acetyltransferase
MEDKITIRPGAQEDVKYLVEWLQQPNVLQWFPLYDLREIEDAANLWISYTQLNSVLTALWDGVPCGITNLYIHLFKKLAHQCLFAIIVDERHRGKGVGTKLLHALQDLAKNQFKIELLHLEVYEGNPAIHLYKRMGFVEYGFQRLFIKEPDRYLGKIMMQKSLIKNAELPL